MVDRASFALLAAASLTLTVGRRGHARIVLTATLTTLSALAALPTLLSSLRRIATARTSIIATLTLTESATWGGRRDRTR